jgi:hypothetical protein
MAGDLAAWKEGVESLRERLGAIPKDGGAENFATQLREAFRVKSGWTTEQDVYACGQLDADILIAACRENLMMWWVPMAAMSYFGDLDGLRKIRAAMEEEPGKCASKPELSMTLTWGCWDYSIIAGVPPVMNPSVVHQLLEWGAKPDVEEYNQGTYFEKALRTSNAGVIRAFLDHGAPPELASKVSRELLAANDYKQAAQIQEAFGMGGFYTKVDNQTLMETKYAPDTGGDAVLRTIFNFGARRVNEVFEFARGGGAMSSCSFDDYDAPALQIAKEKLEKLGGRAEPVVCLLDKPKQAHLARRLP